MKETSDQIKEGLKEAICFARHELEFASLNLDRVKISEPCKCGGDHVIRITKGSEIRKQCLTCWKKELEKKEQGAAAS